MNRVSLYRLLLKRTEKSSPGCALRYDPCDEPDVPDKLYKEVVNQCPSQYIATKELVTFPLSTDKDLRPHKWDFRSFMLIASFDPLVIYFHPGNIHKSVCVMPCLHLSCAHQYFDKLVKPRVCRPQIVHLNEVAVDCRTANAQNSLRRPIKYDQSDRLRDVMLTTRERACVLLFRMLH